MPTHGLFQGILSGMNSLKRDRQIDVQNNRQKRMDDLAATREDRAQNEYMTRQDIAQIARERFDREEARTIDAIKLKAKQREEDLLFKKKPFTLSLIHI